MFKKCLIAALSLLSITATAAPLHQNYDLLDPRTSQQGFTNNWFVSWGDTAGYVSFNINTSFNAKMYLIAYGYDYTGEYGDVIAEGNNFNPISGFLDPIKDKDGRSWSGYHLVVVPVEMSLEEAIVGDYSSYLNHGNSKYTLTGIFPDLNLYNSKVERPEGYTTLNDQYLTASVPEPSSFLLALPLLLLAFKRKLL